MFKSIINSIQKISKKVIQNYFECLDGKQKKEEEDILDSCYKLQQTTQYLRKNFPLSENHTAFFSDKMKDRKRLQDRSHLDKFFTATKHIRLIRIISDMKNDLKTKKNSLNDSSAEQILSDIKQNVTMSLKRLEKLERDLLAQLDQSLFVDQLQLSGKWDPSGPVLSRYSKAMRDINFRAMFPNKDKKYCLEHSEKVLDAIELLSVIDGCKTALSRCIFDHLWNPGRNLDGALKDAIDAFSVEESKWLGAYYTPYALR